MKWFIRTIVTLAALYLGAIAALAGAMVQTPERFGRFMRLVPERLIWQALPARQIWLWARNGSLAVGDTAPDFELAPQNGEGRVVLSSFRGQKPVVLVFGSYT